MKKTETIEEWQKRTGKTIKKVNITESAEKKLTWRWVYKNSEKGSIMRLKRAQLRKASV